MEFQLHKTKNTTFPLVQDTSEKIVREWHRSVEEFMKDLGINRFNVHQFRLLKSEHLEKGTSTETSIEFDGQIIGTVTTSLKNTAAGLKFTITCQKVVPPSSAEQPVDDGVPHEIDYDRGDGTFVTAAL